MKPAASTDIEPPAPGKIAGVRWGLMVLMCLLLSAWCAHLVTGDSIKGDATQNLRIAHNLFHHGSFALDQPGKPLDPDPPTSFREPVVPAFVALYLKLVLPAGPHGFESWHYGEHTRLIKLGNLAWVFAGLMGYWWLCIRLLKHRLWIALGLLLGYTYFFHSAYTVNALYTELHAGVLLIVSCALLISALDSRRFLPAVLSGLAFGLLCLTKSVFLPIAPLVMAALFLASARWGRQTSPGRTLGLLGASWLALALVVGPWILRNTVVMGSSEVASGRSGYVLFKRVLMNQMNRDEYRLGFTLYGPDIYRQWVRGSSLEVVLPDDVSKGGRAQRMAPFSADILNEDRASIAAARPDLSLTFYRKPAALHQQLLRLLEHGAVPQPELVADGIMRQQALAHIWKHPVQHAKVGLLVFWRGFWWAPRHLPLAIPGLPDLRSDINQWMNLATGLSLFVVLFAALRLRRLDWLAITAPAAAMVLAHAGLTQGLPRFNVPAIPFMFLCLSILLAHTIERLRGPGSVTNPPIKAAQ